MPLLPFYKLLRELYDDPTFCEHCRILIDIALPRAPPTKPLLRPRAASLPINVEDSPIPICINPIHADNRVAESIRDIANKRRQALATKAIGFYTRNPVSLARSGPKPAKLEHVKI